MNILNALIFVLACLMCQPAVAQYNRISKQLDISIFPDEGQSRRTQENDENVCYDWAYDQEEYDSRGEKHEEKNNHFFGKVAGGAVAGTVIGALTGNTKRGLLIGTAGGATVGAVGAANQQAERNDRERAKSEKFSKNFAACMKSKDYSVVR